MLRPLTPEQTRTHYERAITNRSPEALAASGADLGALALSDALRNQQSGKLDHLRRGELEEIASPETRASFEQAFTSSERLVGYLGDPTINAPTPEDMVERGADISYLADAFEHMKTEGLDPHIVLTPHGLGAERWRKIAAEMTADASIPNNPLQARDDGHGLWISAEAEANWYAFDKAPAATTNPAHPGSLPTFETIAANGDTISWTIRIIPGTSRPDHLGLSYKDAKAQDIAHQTVPEMLTDKLTTIMVGKEPSDTIVDGSYYYSWCDNGDPAGAAAPCGRWNPGGGRVRVSWDGVGNRYDDLGSRPPVG